MKGLLSTDLGIRFTLVGLLPAATAALVVTSVLLAGAPGKEPSWSQFVGHLDQLSLAEGGALLLAVLVTALVLQPLQLGLVRLLEGYWPRNRVTERVARVRRERHATLRRRVLARTVLPHTETPSDRDLALMAEATEALRLYPAEARLQPTRLGNVLRAAEDRAGSRYGLDAVTAWPRLLPLLPAALADPLADARNALDAAARMTAVWGGASVLLLALLAPYGWWLLLPAGGALVCWLSYSGAIAAAAAYGVLVETAFDLHRFDLLGALHVAPAADAVQEQQVNEKLTAFLLQGGAWPLPYHHPPEGS